MSSLSDHSVFIARKKFNEDVKVLKNEIAVLKSKVKFIEQASNFTIC